MHMLVRSLIANIRKLFAYDTVYASFWLGVTIVIFFFPVMLGWQSLAEAVPTFYSHSTPKPDIKTLWQVDGGWHTIDVIPLVQSEIRMIKEGIPPLWGTYSGGGEPLLVNNAVNVYYPLRLIFFLLWSSLHAFDWYFLLRFFIAGLGMFMYLRVIGLRRIVSLWGGIAYAFTGYFLLYLTYSFLDVEALVPWTLLSIERYFKNQNLRNASLIGALVAMIILVGQPQSAIIAALFVALYFVWKAAAHSKSFDTKLLVKSYWLKVIRHALFIILIALLIALPFAINFLTAYRESASIPDWHTKGLLAFSPMLLLHFIVPPAMMPEVAASGHLFDRFQFIIPYISMSVFLLCFMSFFLKNKPGILFPLYAWIAFVVLKNAGFPLVQWIGALPIMREIGWYKAYGTMAAAIVMCGAVTFEYLMREKPGEAVMRSRSFYTYLAGIPLLFIAAYAFAKSAFVSAYVPNFDFLNRQPEIIAKAMALLERLPGFLQGIASGILQGHGEYLTVALFGEALFAAAATIAIFFFLRRERRRRAAALALIALTAFELWWYMPKVRDGFRAFRPYAQTAPYVEFLQEKMRHEEVSRTFSLGEVFRGHIGELYRIQKAQNNSALKPKRYFFFVPDVIAKTETLVSLVAPEKVSEVPPKFFDAFNVRYLISEQPIETNSRRELIYDQDMKIYENNSALPKAYVVFRKETAAAPEAARDMFYKTSFDPHSAVVLEDMDAVPVMDTDFPSQNGAPWFTPAHITKYVPNEVALQTATDRDGVLVLTDTFFSGWRAYLDGVQVPIYPANVLFRGIFLPAGNHEVRFAYEPWWFWPSITVSGLTILGVIGVLASKRKKTQLLKV